jgi:hypothetical protein
MPVIPVDRAVDKKKNNEKEKNGGLRMWHGDGDNLEAGILVVEFII